MNINDNNKEDSDVARSPAARPPIIFPPKMPQFEGWTTVQRPKAIWTLTGSDGGGYWEWYWYFKTNNPQLRRTIPPVPGEDYNSDDDEDTDNIMEKANDGLEVSTSIDTFYATCPDSSSFSNELGVATNNTNNKEYNNNDNDNTMSKEKKITLKDRIFTVKGTKRAEMVAKANEIGIFRTGDNMLVIEQKVDEYWLKKCSSNVDVYIYCYVFSTGKAGN